MVLPIAFSISDDPHKPTGPGTIVNRLSHLGRRKRTRTALSDIPLSILRKRVSAAPPSPAARYRMPNRETLMPSFV